jgi:hypothetical protein
MCFDYEKFRKENRENLKEGQAIRVVIGFFLEEQKCSLQCVPADIKFSGQKWLPDKRKTKKVTGIPAAGPSLAIRL